jgi:hypothetical protein
VYVGGREDNPNGGWSIAKIWKNGIATNLTDGFRNAEVRSLQIIGSDIYALGEEDNNVGAGVPKYWKNGVANILNLSGSTLSYVRSIFVQGNDVYVAGNIRVTTDPNSNRRAVIWKNNQITYLSDGTTNADAFAVKVNGADVYVSGYNNNKATLWKNGVATSLSTNNSTARSIVIENNDVFCAGTIGNVAVVWKNGTLTNITDGILQAEINSIFVK